MRRIQQTAILALFILSIGCKSSYYSPSQVDVAYNRVSEVPVAPDAEVESIIVDYRVQLEKEMNVVIGQLAHDISKTSPESDIGNWMVDIMHDEANLMLDQPVDFSVQNQGGIRVSSMSAGPITVGEVFEVMPFDNMISILTADGAGVQEFMDHIAEGRGWPISAGTSFKIKNKKAVYVMINGQPLDLAKTYRFALPDYIANGGSGSDFLSRHPRQDLDVLIRDAMLTNIKRDTEQGITQSPVIEGRIINLDNE